MPFRRKNRPAYAGRRKQRAEQLVTADSECCFCHQGLNEECGLFFNDVEAKIAAHQFCLFFSSGLPQLGEDTEGFDGFLYKDIIKEAQRANKILCKFCQQPGASVGCSLKTCRTSYHYLCGWKQGLQFVFHDCFDSFCKAHCSKQDLSALKDKTQEHLCPLCLEDVARHVNKIIKTPCCKNMFVHRECVQTQANNAGYFFRCPTCNNQELFQKEMSTFGVYIPQRDAAWEKNNAFGDLLESYDKCDSAECRCPFGKSHIEDEGDWDLLRCYHCGQSGVHRACLGADVTPEYEFVCRDCNDVVGVNKINSVVSPERHGERWEQHKLLLKQLRQKKDPILLSCGMPSVLRELHGVTKQCRVVINPLPVFLIDRLQRRRVISTRSLIQNYGITVTNPPPPRAWPPKMRKPRGKQRRRVCNANIARRKKLEGQTSTISTLPVPSTIQVTHSHTGDTLPAQSASPLSNIHLPKDNVNKTPSPSRCANGNRPSETSKTQTDSPSSNSQDSPSLSKTAARILSAISSPFVSSFHRKRTLSDTFSDDAISVKSSPSDKLLVRIDRNKTRSVSDIISTDKATLGKTRSLSVPDTVRDDESEVTLSADESCDEDEYLSDEIPFPTVKRLLPTINENDNKKLKDTKLTHFFNEKKKPTTNNKNTDKQPLHIRRRNSDLKTIVKNNHKISDWFRPATTKNPKSSSGNHPPLKRSSPPNGNNDATVPPSLFYNKTPPLNSNDNNKASSSTVDSHPSKVNNYTNSKSQTMGHNKNMPTNFNNKSPSSFSTTSTNNNNRAGKQTLKRPIPAQVQWISSDSEADSPPAKKSILITRPHPGKKSSCSKISSANKRHDSLDCQPGPSSYYISD